MLSLVYRHSYVLQNLLLKYFGGSGVGAPRVGGTAARRKTITFIVYTFLKSKFRGSYTQKAKILE